MFDIRKPNLLIGYTHDTDVTLLKCVPYNAGWLTLSFVLDNAHVRECRRDCKHGRQDYFSHLLNDFSNPRSNNKRQRAMWYECPGMVLECWNEASW